jgi:L-lactate dehydrogenase complex protein LldF
MLPENRPETFVENYRRALSDPRLQRAMSNATAKFEAARRQAPPGGEAEWQRLRDRAREIKERTVGNLDYYLEQFSANVERRGGRVFWARDAGEANHYINEVARRQGVRLAVKGKSMLSEEIGLNHALAEAGVESVETDFGEYVAQLAGQRPSHINMPIVHMSRGDVADLFARRLHVERMGEIEQMTGLARRLLRERFAAADMGVTGVNFAVAETGTIVLVENEGNIRLCTSLPRVQVALMSIEKVIPRFADLEVFLKLLPLSASGQKMTANVTFVTGARGAGGGEASQEFHVVILDNGRVDMLANPELREALYCIRCGACLNICPVYQKIGGHAYGWVYPGPIGAVLTPQLIGREKAAELPFASSLCGACRDVCPVKINLPEMLLHLRHEIKEPAAEHARTTPEAQAGPLLKLKRSLARALERASFKLWAAAMKSPAHYARAARLARLIRRVSGDGRNGLARLLPVSRWTAARDLPPPAARSFREQWAEMSKSAGPRRHG